MIRYRREIDGLRAVAVVPVVLYHADVTGFSGGFVGVDVFFVISGYLITQILLDDLDAGRYSIARFYERRARRILPALFAVLLASVAAAWLTMTPDQLREFTRSLAAVLGFSSNILFWRQEGYFATAADLKPLLHTWSLAVEEQFYLVFPLVLRAFATTSRGRLAAIVVAGALVSFMLCEIASRTMPTANFYLLPTRAWELLAGSACVFAGRRSHQRFAPLWAAAGLALIIYAVIALAPGVPFPSRYALFPVLGTALVIVFGHSGKGIGRLLSLAPLVGIGLVSYSFYLWHQPLFAFARIVTLRPLDHTLVIALIAASLALAYLSWRFVEQPFRRRDERPSPKATWTIAAICLGLFGAAAIYAEATDGAQGRLHRNRDPAVAAFVASARKDAALPGNCITEGPDLDVAPCRAAGTAEGDAKIAVFGDSHALALAPALGDLAHRTKASVLFAASPGCPPLLGAYVLGGNGAADRCPARARAQLNAAVSNRVAVVYLVGRWQLYTNGDPFLRSGHYLLSTVATGAGADRSSSRAAFAKLVRSTVETYRRAGIAVVLVGEVPEQSYAIDRLVAGLAFMPPGEELGDFVRSRSIARAEADLDNAFAAAALRSAGAAFVDPRPIFASGGRYLWGDGRVSWYADSSHLSPLGARRLMPVLAESMPSRALVP